MFRGPFPKGHPSVQLRLRPSTFPVPTDTTPGELLNYFFPKKTSMRSSLLSTWVFTCGSTFAKQNVAVMTAERTTIYAHTLECQSKFFDFVFGQDTPPPFVGNRDLKNLENYGRSRLRGAWSDRDANNIFAHRYLIFDFKFSNFVCPSELHPLIWFFCKTSSRKKKNIRKTTQNALAPSIFIVLSIVMKLGTPLLHTQAQNTLLQNFLFRSRSRDMDEKPPKTLFYPTWSASKHNLFRR